MIVFGLHPVLEAIRAQRVKTIRVSERGGARIRDVVDAAARAGIPVRRVAPQEIERASKGGVHQGVVAEVEDRGPLDVSDLVAGAQGPALLVVLDGIEDPHNVGAILRTVDAVGGHGVVRQMRHAAALDGVAAKASAGAVSHVKIADVVNIARAVEELKDAGVWTVGLAAEGDVRYDEIDFTVPVAVVMGAEGSGLRRLVRERCDFLAFIPMAGHVQSLNVSVATGVVLFEALRQRRASNKPGAV